VYIRRLANERRARPRSHVELEWCARRNGRNLRIFRVTLRRRQLAEIDYGKWDGRTAEDVDAEYHDEYERWMADPAWNPPTGGETAVALAQRVTHVFEEIRAAHHDGNVLVVSHKATIRVALCALLGVDVGRFRYRFGCPVGSVSIVAFGGHGPLAETVADRSHLAPTLRALERT